MILKLILDTIKKVAAVVCFTTLAFFTRQMVDCSFCLYFLLGY